MNKEDHNEIELLLGDIDKNLLAINKDNPPLSIHSLRLISCIRDIKGILFWILDQFPDDFKEVGNG